MDNPKVAKVARITELRDQWLLKNNKMNLDLKARLKKTKVAKQKKQAKLDKTCQKTQEKAQINDIRRLAIGNRQIGTFKDTFPDPVSLLSNNLAVLEASAPLSASTMQTINRMLAVRQNQKAKRKSIVNWQATNIKR